MRGEGSSSAIGRSSARAGRVGRAWRWALALPICLGAVSLFANGAQAAGRAALIVDANSGRDLYGHDAERPLYPASLTKMMTLYIVFDMMAQKRISNATKIQVTERCANQPPSNLELAPGDTIALREAVLALIVKSANDVACAVGENLAGTEEKFAQIMTARARQLGMKATTFRNASGLPDPAQVTTARDLSVLALHLIRDFPEQYRLFATREFVFNGRAHRTHNGLLRSFEGVDGIKTGYTRASGFNLVSSVRRGPRHVVGIVMGGVTAAQRNATMRALLTQGLARASTTPRMRIAQRAAPVPEPAVLKPPVPRRVAQESPPSQALRSSAVAQAEPAAKSPVAVTPTVSRDEGRAQAVRLPVPGPHAAPVAAADAKGTGRPPSSLQAQATGETIPAPVRQATPVQHYAAPEKPAGLGAKSRSGAAPAHGPFQVQIGAFSNETEARKHLGVIAERAGALLAGHAPVTMPITKANLQFYRARFAGFSEAKAQSACQSLKAQRIECVVMRAE